MISKAFVEESGNKRLEPEMQAACDALRQRNIPVELFTEKRLQRRQLALSRDTLVVGYVQTVLSALHQLGIAPPPTNDYPGALQPMLHRHIWESTVEHLKERVYAGREPVFAKPIGRKKRFTGSIFVQPEDLQYLEGASGRTPVLCSDVVDWLSEYRVYVVQSSIIGIKPYAGDPAIHIDERLAAEAVRLLDGSGELTAAYALDLGVLSSGQTALVEWNDGFALGNYGLEAAAYTDLLIARWCELTGIAGH